MNIADAAEEIGISVDAYKSLCATFLKTTKEDINALSSAVEEVNRKKISNLAHHIKGSAANMELMELSEEAKALDAAAEQAPVSELRACLESIQEMFNKLEEELRVQL